MMRVTRAWEYPCQEPDADGSECSLREASQNLDRDLSDHSGKEGKRFRHIEACCLERCLRALAERSDP